MVHLKTTGIDQQRLKWLKFSELVTTCGSTAEVEVLRLCGQVVGGCVVGPPLVAISWV